MKSMKYKEQDMGPAIAAEPAKPTLYIPLTPAIVKSVDLGDEVVLTIRGIVKGSSVREDRSELQLELHESKIKRGEVKEPEEKAAEQFKEMADEEMG
jgi:hypothetical protein